MYTHRPQMPMKSTLVKPQTDAFLSAIAEMDTNVQADIERLIDFFACRILAAQSKYFMNRDAARKDATLFVSKLVWYGVLDTVRITDAQ